MRFLPTLLCTVLGTAPVTGLVAQAVLVVGPGGYPEIRDAIVAAAPGDLVLITPGTYGAFLLDKGLTLLALPGGPVTIVPDQTRALTECAIPWPQHAHLSRLDFYASNPTVTAVPGRLIMQLGLISMDGCSLPNVTETIGMDITAATVTATDCLFTGNPAVFLSAGTLAAAGTTFLGSTASIAGPGGRGVHTFASSLHLAHCTVHGGDTGTSSFGAGEGIFVSVASTVRISDSSVVGGTSSGSSAAGIGLLNIGSSPIVHARTTFTGGSPTTPGLFGLAQGDELVGAMLQPARLALGVTSTLQSASAPGSLVVFAGSLDLAQPSLSPVLVERHWLSPNAIVLGGAIADAAGAATLGLAVPNQLALRGVGAWLHVVAGTQIPLHVSPPVGGVVQ